MTHDICLATPMCIGAFQKKTLPKYLVGVGVAKEAAFIKFWMLKIPLKVRKLTINLHLFIVSTLVYIE